MPMSRQLGARADDKDDDQMSARGASDRNSTKPKTRSREHRDPRHGSREASKLRSRGVSNGWRGVCWFGVSSVSSEVH